VVLPYQGLALVAAVVALQTGMRRQHTAVSKQHVARPNGTALSRPCPDRCCCSTADRHEKTAYSSVKAARGASKWYCPIRALP
jgi:hypothetical protein